jgi:hypothetical protein
MLASPNNIISLKHAKENVKFLAALREKKKGAGWTSYIGNNEGSILDACQIRFLQEGNPKRDPEKYRLRHPTLSLQRPV